jgi:UDP-glucuronate 4-epimerase
MSILVTGAAGFIGFHVANALLERGERVVGIDNLNEYYDVRLKEARLARLRAFPSFEFAKLDVADRDGVFTMVERHKDLRSIIHLAAQAGVRYSLENPYAYIDANVTGTLVMFEAARRIKHLTAITYASSSSVYGANRKQPFSIDDRVDHPVSLYAATKRSCELIAQTYGHLYGLPATGLRFFTVYGPWGRPDMAAFLFTRAILAGEPIKVFNEGRMARDFTYIDDIVAGTIAAHDRLPTAAEGVPHRIYNLGNHRPEKLLDFIAVLERELGRTAEKQFLPLQPGDVPASFADIEASRRDLGFEPKTTIEVGLARFVQWYKQYYQVNLSVSSWNADLRSSASAMSVCPSPSPWRKSSSEWSVLTFRSSGSPRCAMPRIRPARSPRRRCARRGFGLPMTRTRWTRPAFLSSRCRPRSMPNGAPTFRRSKLPAP